MRQEEDLYERLTRPRLPRAYRTRLKALARSYLRPGPGRHRAPEQFLLFVGHPRSGSTVTGSLLDAHPDAVIAHELDVLKYLEAGFSRRELTQLLIDQERWFVGANGAQWNGYDYFLPTMWQGRWRQMRLLGDKKAGTTTHRIAEDPGLVDRLSLTYGCPVRFVNAIRNPLDTLATLIRSFESARPAGRLGPEVLIDGYFRRCEQIEMLREERPDDVFDVYNEELIHQPERTMSAVCDFLGLPPVPGFLEACRAQVRSAPRRTRSEAPWADAMVAQVQERSAEFPFLERYLDDMDPVV